MAFSLFFTYANTENDKAHFKSLSKHINPFVVKHKSGELLDCENEDLLETHAENAHVIVVLLSSDYLEYDNHPKRKKLHNKISTFISDPSKFIITVEIEDCLWQCDPSFNGLETTHKLQKTGGSDFDYMPVVRGIMKEINERKPKVFFEKLLHDGLYGLNFDEQRTAFNAHFKELSLLNILVIGGTLECGQHLLLKTFLRLQKINYDEQSLIRLSAKNFVLDQSEDWIWDQIGEKFRLSYGYNNLQSIGNYAIQRLQIEPIFIRFDDIHLVKKESIEVIKTIWEQLYQYINSRRVTLNYQIFVFVTDRSGEDVFYSKQEFSSPEYAPICDRILCILPKIKFLNKADMTTWLSFLSRDPDLQIIGKHLEVNHVLPDDLENISIAKAVGNMIDKLGELDEDLKNNKSLFLARI